VIDVDGVTCRYGGGSGDEAGVTAVDDVSLSVPDGEFLLVAGANGSGKTTLVRTFNGLAVPDSGTVAVNGTAVEDDLVAARSAVGMVFQDPLTALNSVYTIGEQIAEAVRLHRDATDAEARERAIEVLDAVGIPDPEERYDQYPHEFSGGMQQRVIIAIALSCDPDLLICDEPTTALDVTIEAQILELLQDLSEEFDMAIQFITHDLGVVAEICDRMMVMYAGEVVEQGTVEEIYYEPQHPYTVGLMSSIPRVGSERDELDTIPGTMPDLVKLPTGCSFHPRCPYAEEACTRLDPQLVDVDTGRPVDGPDRTTHSAACLAHSGELDGELTYSVDIVEETETEDTDTVEDTQ